MEQLAAFGRALGKQTSESSSITDAIVQDDPIAVARFLSQGTDVNSTNEDGWTPLQVACWHDKLKACAEVLKGEPKLDIQDSAGRTAAHLAAFNGSDRCLRKILHAGANPNLQDKHGLTALHKAAATGRLEAIRILLEFKADPSLSTPDGQLSPLHLAAWKGQREAIRHLATVQGIDMQARSHDGSTPLHEAVRSGDTSTVELLLQLGANAALADRFGRTPGDLAFAAGNRTLFSKLYDAALKAAKPDPEPEAPKIPDPSDFWQYLQSKAPKLPGVPQAAQAQLSPSVPVANPAAAPTAPTPAAGTTPETHPRKQFEAWLGGVLFPKHRRGGHGTTSGASPYGSVNKVQAPPPSVAMPAFNKLMGSGAGAAPAHTVGSIGGSNFAARRAQQAKEAAAKTTVPTRPEIIPPAAPAAGAPASNVTLGLDPYEASAPAGASTPPSAAGDKKEDAGVPENPLASMMQALGRKAQEDFSNAMKAASDAAAHIKNQTSGTTPGTGKVSTEATMGNPEFYDDDDYDVGTFKKVEAGAKADAEDWGEFEDKYDDWGTSGSAALAAKKRAQRAAAKEGRIYTVQEAREKLEQLDLATSRAQGWIRGKDAAQRLAAMETLISAYPSKPATTAAPAAAASAPEEPRVEAGNPLHFLMQGLWQQRPHRQEEERMAVQAHLQSSTAAASVAAQASAPKPPAVPEINFYEAWKATDAFSSENLLIEDSFGKVYKADILGGTHALRVLGSSLYSSADLQSFLKTNASLSHAHMVSLKGASSDRGLLVYNLPESGNLLYILQTAVLPTTEALAWNSCVDIALSVASALQYLHSQPEPVAHGQLNSSMVYFDRNADAAVGGVGLAQLCDKNSPDPKALLLKDVHALGEIVMQLLTLNTQPIDDEMRKSISAYIASGQHIHPSDALNWPKAHAEAFEAVAIACMEAKEGTDTATLLRDAVLPTLLSLRGETLQSMMNKSEPAAPLSRADGSIVVPAAFRCPLTNEVMLDPVRAADGFVYERSAIEQWLQMGRKKSPMTNEALSHPYLIPQQALRGSIEAWLRSQASETPAPSAPVAAW